MRFMEQNILSTRGATVDGTPAAASKGERAVNVALVYQDAPTRQWAKQAGERLGQEAGEEAVHCTEWKISDLVEPSVYSDSVRALARADVIVISLYEAERLPSVFYLWVNLWLQVRAGLPGSLVALVVPAEEPSFGANETRRYLCAVASQGGLELLESNQPGRPIRGFRQDSFQWSNAA